MGLRTTHSEVTIVFTNRIVSGISGRGSRILAPLLVIACVGCGGGGDYGGSGGGYGGGSTASGGAAAAGGGATTPAPTVTLSVQPTTITAGQSATLTWSSTNASDCT